MQKHGRDPRKQPRNRPRTTGTLWPGLRDGIDERAMATNPDRGAPLKFGELLRGYRVSARQPWRALCLAGAAARLRRDYATPPTPTEIRQLDRWLERARAELGGPNAEAAVALGECFSAEEAVAEALALDVTQQVPSCRPTEVRATATAEPEASRCRGSRFPAAS